MFSIAREVGSIILFSTNSKVTFLNKSVDIEIFVFSELILLKLAICLISLKESDSKEFSFLLEISVVLLLRFIKLLITSLSSEFFSLSLVKESFSLSISFW